MKSTRTEIEIELSLDEISTQIDSLIDDKYSDIEGLVNQNYEQGFEDGKDSIDENRLEKIGLEYAIQAMKDGQTLIDLELLYCRHL